MDEWMSITDASNVLNVTISLIGTLVKRGDIEVRQDIIDHRIKLVNVTEIRELLSRSVKGKQQK